MKLINSLVTLSLLTSSTLAFSQESNVDAVINQKSTKPASPVSSKKGKKSKVAKAKKMEAETVQSDVQPEISSVSPRIVEPVSPAPSSKSVLSNESLSGLYSLTPSYFDQSSYALRQSRSQIAVTTEQLSVSSTDSPSAETSGQLSVFGVGVLPNGFRTFGLLSSYDDRRPTAHILASAGAAKSLNDTVGLGIGLHQESSTLHGETLDRSFISATGLWTLGLVDLDLTVSKDYLLVETAVSVSDDLAILASYSRDQSGFGSTVADRGTLGLRDRVSTHLKLSAEAGIISTKNRDISSDKSMSQSISLGADVDLSDSMSVGLNPKFTKTSVTSADGKFTMYEWIALGRLIYKL